MTSPAPQPHPVAAAAALLTALAVLPAGGWLGAQARPVSPCDLRPGAAHACIDLLARAAYEPAGGVVTLERYPGPFTVNLSPAGIHQFRFRFELAGLPAGDPGHYVAWLVTPMLDSTVRLGEVSDGMTLLGPAGFTKYMVMVSAESTPAPAGISGPLVLRGQSPSSMLQPHGADALPPQRMEDHHAHEAGGWFMPPMHPQAPRMVAGLERLRPPAAPYLPPEADSLPLARPRGLVRLATGDTLRLEAGLVRRNIGNRAVTMFAFNRQHPGPLLDVPQGAEIVVDFTNRLDQPTTVHWHGLRLDNRFDGVPGLTQDPVPPGGRYRYRLRFPDAGVYWYHPHVREDIQQDLGLAGNMLVRPAAAWPRVDHEEVLMLDDLLVGPEGLLPWGAERATHALMGRFGNLLLVNGEPGWRGRYRTGDVVRFYLTNASNTRAWNLSIPGVRLRLVAGDVSRYEREEWVESVPLAPAERYVVEARFERPGGYPLLNRIQGIDHVNGLFFAEVDTLGSVTVDGPADAGPGAPGLREHAEVAAELARYRDRFDDPPERTLALTLRIHDLPFGLIQTLRLDTAYVNPVEWTGSMPMMDWLSTAGQVEWVIRDSASGQENMAIAWGARVGEVARVRLVNDVHTLHPMAHPIHLHGQRFLVLGVNGVPNTNLVWKDTALVPAGGSLDLLVEFSNPGRWMLHCHIAEHLEAGMHTVIEVEGGG